MTRKISKQEIERDRESAYDAVLKAVRVTTMEERTSIAMAWCQNKDNLRAWEGMCKERGILPIDLLIVSLMQVDHPLLTKPNGDFALQNFVHARLRLIQATLRNEPVPIPLGTARVQLDFVPNSQPKEMAAD